MSKLNILEGESIVKRTLAVEMFHSMDQDQMTEFIKMYGLTVGMIADIMEVDAVGFPEFVEGVLSFLGFVVENEVNHLEQDFITIAGFAPQDAGNAAQMVLNFDQNEIF